MDPLAQPAALSPDPPELVEPLLSLPHPLMANARTAPTPTARIAGENFTLYASSSGRADPGSWTKVGSETDPPHAAR